MRYKSLITFLLVAVAFFSLGYVTERYLNRGGEAKMNIEAVKQEAYNNGWQAAKKRLTSSGLTGVAEFDSSVHKSVDGTVETINDEKIVIKIKPLQLLADESLDKRTVTISNTTKIVKIEQKNENDYQKELDAFYKENPQLKNTGEAVEGSPSHFVEKQVSKSELSVGMKVVVNSDKDITNDPEFLATEIIVSE